MTMIKIALTGAASLGLVIAGVANAEPTRASASFPGVVSAKKIKLTRSAAPAKRESKQAAGGLPPALIGGAAGLAGGTALGLTIDSNNCPSTGC